MVATTEAEESTSVSEESATVDASTTEEEPAATTDSIDMFNLPEPQEYYENMSQAILDDTYKTIMGGMDAYEYKDGNSGIGEFVIKFAMFGTIPSYGISYKDESGKTYYYGLTESGMDGSPMLTEIVVK